MDRSRNCDRSQPILTREQSRSIDEIAVHDLGMSSLVLMENAGRGVAESLRRRGAKQVSIACGRGNNGGDGFVAARHLSLSGIRVHVLWLAPANRLSADAAANFRLLEYCDVRWFSVDERSEEGHYHSWLDGSDWCVDCLLGTGASGSLRPEFQRILAAMRMHSSKKLAVDVPTGLDCDTGWVDPHTCPANVTCSLVTLKRGMFVDPGRSVCGELEVIEIGIPPIVLQRIQLEA